MDIKTKFNVKDQAYILKAINDPYNIKLLKGRIKNIDISIGESDDINIIYKVFIKDLRENFSLRENLLFKNHKEVMEFIFDENNMRVYLSDDYKENSNEKDKGKEVSDQTIINDLLTRLQPSSPLRSNEDKEGELLTPLNIDDKLKEINDKLKEIT